MKDFLDHPHAQLSSLFQTFKQSSTPTTPLFSSRPLLLTSTSSVEEVSLLKRTHFFGSISTPASCFSEHLSQSYNPFRGPAYALNHFSIAGCYCYKSSHTISVIVLIVSFVNHISLRSPAHSRTSTLQLTGFDLPSMLRHHAHLHMLSALHSPFDFRSHLSAPLRIIWNSTCFWTPIQDISTRCFLHRFAKVICIHPSVNFVHSHLASRPRKPASSSYPKHNVETLTSI